MTDDDEWVHEILCYAKHLQALIPTSFALILS